jgi:hypothetical protein
MKLSADIVSTIISTLPNFVRSWHTSHTSIEIGSLGSLHSTTFKTGAHRSFRHGICWISIGKVQRGAWCNILTCCVYIVFFRSHQLNFLKSNYSERKRLPSVKRTGMHDRMKWDSTAKGLVFLFSWPITIPTMGFGDDSGLELVRRQLHQ